MSKYDFKKEVDKIKKQFVSFSKEAAKIAKKSEEEIIKFSKQSKMHIDSTAYSLKKEKLYYQIGKEYVKLKDRSKPSAALNKFLKDLQKLEDEQKALKTKIKKTKKKTAVKKKTSKPKKKSEAKSGAKKES